MKHNKGLELPMNVIVLIAAVVLVLLVVGVFFLSSTGGQISRADAESIFRKTCQSICQPLPQDNYLAAGRIQVENKEFLAACTTLGYGSREYPNRCLAQCGCDMAMTNEEISQNLGNLQQAGETLKTGP